MKDTFAAEVRKFVSDGRKQDKLIQNLVASFMDGLKTMGEYQRVNVEEQSATNLATIENRINGSINEVLEEVVDLKDQLPGLPAPEEEEPPLLS